MLLKEREFTQAKAAVTKKGSGQCLVFERKRFSGEKKGRVGERILGRSDRGGGLEKKETVGLTVEKWRKNTSLEVKVGRIVSTFVGKCPLLLTWTFVRRGQQR